VGLRTSAQPTILTTKVILRGLDELNQFKTKGKKAIGTIEKLKQYVKNIKRKIKLDISLIPALE
jgi:hypothetical protein